MRNRIKSLLIITTLLFSFNSIAEDQLEITVGLVIEFYKEKDTFPPELVKSFDAWLAGNLSGINNTLLINKSKYDNKKFICTPDNLIITPDMAIQTLKDYVEAEIIIDVKNLPAGFILVLALERTFPCNT